MLFRAGMHRMLPVMLLLLFFCGSAPGADEAAWQRQIEEGRRHLAEGETAGALECFEKALGLNPRSSAAKTGKATALARRGDLREAERLLREALPLNPDPCRIHHELGRISQQRGDFRQAITEFKLGIEKCRDESADR